MTKSRARTKIDAAKSLATHDEAVAAGQSHAAEEPPPIGGRWSNLYLAVLLILAALVILFYLFTRAFR